MEIDKIFAGAHENQSTDSGVSSRVLSYFLNWLSERDCSATADARIFVMVTMNRTTGVPEELLRAGRFDRVWATDLPNDAERREILGIHMAKRGILTSEYQEAELTKIVKATAEFTGAEIEELVVSARTDAYDKRMSEWEESGRKKAAPTAMDCFPSVEELIEAAGAITPVSRLNAESIQATRAYCASKAYPVNGGRTNRDSVLRKRASRHVQVQE